MSRPSGVSPAVPADVCDGGGGGGGAFATRLRALRRGWLQVFGIPDYERYLDHHAAHHPGEPVLSRREFFAKAIDRKYCRSGPRCC
jgi:uncharacterized short protein YbdD (DUF466 family)